jgi:hypothetical protein
MRPLEPIQQSQIFLFLDPMEQLSTVSNSMPDWLIALSASSHHLVMKFSSSFAMRDRLVDPNSVVRAFAAMPAALGAVEEVKSRYLVDQQWILMNVLDGHDFS